MSNKSVSYFGILGFLLVLVVGCTSNPYGDKAISLDELEGIWLGHAEFNLTTTRVQCSATYPVRFRVREGRATSLCTDPSCKFDVALKRNGGINFIYKEAQRLVQRDTSTESYIDLHFTGQLSTSGVGEGAVQASGCVGKWKVTKQTTSRQDAAEDKPIAYRVVLTTGINADKKPINDLTEISIHKKPLYVFVNWAGLQKGYRVKTKITDSSGALIWEREDVTSKRLFATWHWYTINQNKDKPGKWKIEVYVDNIKKAEKYITILPHLKATSHY